MTTVVKRCQTVPYTCEQMFQLVDNVENYDQYLPYCSRSMVHYRDDDEVQATLQISAAGMKKSFTTCNLVQKNKMIEIRLVDGPFRHLEGFWRFEPVEEGCKISFDLEFELAGRMLSVLLGPVFEQIASKMIDAFCDRAESLYVTS